MPANVVKTKRDERLWNKAKERAAEEGKAENYAYIMGIFKKMKGKSASEERVASRWLTAYRPGIRDPLGWDPGSWESIPSDKGVGSQVPPARDRDGKPNPPEDLGVMKIPGYKWQDRDNR